MPSLSVTDSIRLSYPIPRYARQEIDELISLIQTILRTVTDPKGEVVVLGEALAARILSQHEVLSHCTPHRIKRNAAWYARMEEKVVICITARSSILAGPKRGP